ncbi:MAG: hypothetical protein R3F62_24550 [Planctomycetota bacterium]
MTRCVNVARALITAVAAVLGGVGGFVLGAIALILGTAYGPYPGYEPTWAPGWLYLVPAVWGAAVAAFLARAATAPRGTDEGSAR